MRRWVLLLIMGLVMALVMFGRNPMKEMQQKVIALRKKYGSDAVTQETNIYIEQQKRQSGGLGLPSTNVAPPDTEAGIPDAGNEIFIKQVDDGIVVDDKGKNAAKPSVTNTTIPPATTSYTPPAYTTPKKSYYPPVIDGNAPSLTAPKLSALESNKTLRSGQRIEFSGMYVYAIGADGAKTPLPDGIYTLYDGTQIKVRAGKRIGY